MQQHCVLFDHLIGAGEQHWRHFEAEQPCGRGVDDQLELGGRLHRQVGRLLALEDAVDVAGGTPELIGIVRPVGDQAADSFASRFTALGDSLQLTETIAGRKLAWVVGLLW
jgi:hypothetical protein